MWGGAWYFSVTIDVSAKSVLSYDFTSTPENTNVKFSDSDDGFTRVSVERTTDNLSSGITDYSFRLKAVEDQADGTSGFLLQWPQFENSRIATSQILTDGTVATRDRSYMQRDLGVDRDYGGSLLVELYIDPDNLSDSVEFIAVLTSASSGFDANRLAIASGNNNVGSVHGVPGFNSFSNQPSEKKLCRAAVVWDGTESRFFFDGVYQGSRQPPGSGELRVALGSDRSSSTVYQVSQQHYTHVEFIPKKLSDDEAEALTS